MKLTDKCPACVEPKSLKEYQAIPKTLCPVCVEPTPEPPKPTLKTVTEYCLRAYMRSVATTKYCTIPPRGCS